MVPSFNRFPLVIAYYVLLPGETSGSAGSGATLPVPGSDVPLLETKPEVGTRNFGHF